MITPKDGSRLGAFERYVELIGVPVAGFHRIMDEFANLLGFDKYSHLWDAHTQHDDPELERQIVAINGPYGGTVLKMLMAKQHKGD